MKKKYGCDGGGGAKISKHWQRFCNCVHKKEKNYIYILN